MIAEQAAEWHVAHSEGCLSPQQAREFMHWLRTSPVHVAEYLAIATLAKDLSGAARESTSSIRDLLAEGDDRIRALQAGNEAEPLLHERVLLPQSSRVRIPVPMRLKRALGRSVVRWAVAAAMLAAISTIWMAGSPWLMSKPIIDTYATHHGQDRTLRLSDNTVVQLDSDSAITVRFDRSSRHVVLDRGQVYFKVAKDSGRPFSVQVGRSLIRDIGTTFDIYRHASGTTITVEEGRVQVWTVPQRRSEEWLGWLWHTKQGEPVAELGSGRQVRVSNTGQVTSLGTVDVNQSLAWTHGRIAFDDVDVASVAAEFNRYNNTQITVVDPGIGELKISGAFDSHDVAAFLAFLESLPGVRIEMRGQQVIVYPERQRRGHKE